MSAAFVCAAPRRGRRRLGARRARVRRPTRGQRTSSVPAAIAPRHLCPQNSRDVRHGAAAAGARWGIAGDRYRDARYEAATLRSR